MGLFTKEKAVPLTDDQRKLVEVTALTVVKKHLRAEARAQATVAKKELTDKFNKVIAECHRGISNLKQDVQILADNNLRLTVICAVQQDLMEAGISHLAKAEFAKKCDIKKAEYELQAGRA